MHQRYHVSRRSTLPPMRLWPLALVVLIACGSSGAKTSTPTTMAVITQIATTSTTSTVPATTTTTTIAATTTTTVALSREARLAVVRCKDSMGPFFASEVTLDLPASTHLDVAKAACKEALLQIDADNPRPGSTGSKLAYEVSKLNAAVAFSALDVVLGTFDATKETVLQKAVNDFEAGIATLV